jgi:hypothetical protein
MYIIYKMPISREMDDIIKRLQIDDLESLIGKYTKFAGSCIIKKR